MMRTFLKSGVAFVAALAVGACSGTPATPTAPSAAAGGTATAAADGSTLKVTAPTLLAPVNGVQVDTRRPVLEWSPSSGSYVVAAPSYEVQVSSGGTLLYSTIIDGTSHQVPSDAEYDAAYEWRVRARIDENFGPWSAAGSFQGPAAPQAATASLPFAVPASCGPVPNPPGNRAQCASDVAAVSPEWGRCQGGSGLGCHRYTRHLAAALATGDPRWGLITKNANEQQCTWDACGRSVRGGYGEDVVAFRHGPNDSNWEGWDVVSGAGAPGASAGWSRLPSRRAGNNWAPVPPFP
jgi:hypothetical protein